MLWSPNLQLSYPFENQVNDYSRHARHGTLYGSGVFATKPNGGRCLYFDGTGDYVATPSFALGGTVVWFAADVRCRYNTGTQHQSFICQNSDNPDLWVLRLSGTNDLYSDYYRGSGFAIFSGYFDDPFDNAWLHLLVVSDYTGKKVYAYRNGVPFSSPVTMTGTVAFPSTDNAKFIGTFNTINYFLTDGYLANVQLGTLASCPPIAALTANANRLMLGMHPIWSV
jgi:hypothetical protein